MHTDCRSSLSNRGCVQQIRLVLVQIQRFGRCQGSLPSAFYCRAAERSAVTRVSARAHCRGTWLATSIDVLWRRSSEPCMLAGFAQDMHTSQQRKALLSRALAAQRHVSRWNYISKFAVALFLLPLGLTWPVVQDQNLFRPPASQPGPKQVTIKSSSRGRKGKSKQSPSKQMPDPMSGNEPRQLPVAAPVAAARRAMFAERLHDAQGIEDLFEVNLAGIFLACTAHRLCHVHLLSN